MRYKLKVLIEDTQLNLPINKTEIELENVSGVIQQLNRIITLLFRLKITQNA